MSPKTLIIRGIKRALRVFLNDSQIQHLKVLKVKVKQSFEPDPKKVRKAKYSKVSVPHGRFSFLMTVWNTEPEFFVPLMESVTQLHGFSSAQFVILDNGTKKPETLEILQRYSEKFKNIKLIRTEENQGIIGGMNLVLNAAEGEFVLPIDSDDYLYPDALQVLSDSIDKNPESRIFYSDEDKVKGNEQFQAYNKPEWDPVLFYHSCYIAHLCAFDRKKAIEYGVYTSDKVNGCHDWDTFSRFYLAGHSPKHIPEVLYSWRIHEGSTAGNIDSKNYIHNSHISLLSDFLRKTNKDSDFEVSYSPLFNQTPDWRFKSLRPFTKNLLVVKNSDFPLPLKVQQASVEEIVASDLDEVLLELKERDLDLSEFHVVFLHQKDASFSSDYLEEAQTMFELFPNVVGVGGRTLKGDLVHSGAYRWKDGHFVNHQAGCHKNDPGYFAQNLKPHSSDGLPLPNTIWDGAFLKGKLKRSSFEDFEQDLLYMTHRSENRVVFNPLMEVRA